MDYRGGCPGNLLIRFNSRTDATYVPARANEIMGLHTPILLVYPSHSDIFLLFLRLSTRFQN